MQELGVRTTAEGSTAARLQLESDEGMPGWASGSASRRRGRCGDWSSGRAVWGDYRCSCGRWVLVRT